jgi:tetratricopeptide (TPR) repeat protein
MSAMPPDQDRALFAGFLSNFAGERALEVYDLDRRVANTRAALNLAKTAEERGNWLEAFKAYERAYSWWPDQTSEGVALGREIRAGLVRVYLKLPVKPPLPEYARRYAVQAETFAREKSYDQAIDAYKKVTNAAYWWPDAYFNLAVLLGDQKKYADAIQYMKAYLTLVPNAPDARGMQDKIYEWETKLSTR